MPSPSPSSSALWLFFGFTLTGKALRATAVNRLGARLVGIRTTLSGQIAFLMAALIGAISGILIVPITTLYYDTGFLIGLKGFVAAIIGGLVSYPLTAVAALVVGIVEAFSSFYASDFKEVIVFFADPAGARAAVAFGARGRGGEGLMAMPQRLPILAVRAGDGGDPVHPGRAAVLDRAAGQYRPLRAGGDGARAADRRRRPHLVRPGRVLRLRRLYHGGADHDLWPVAMADAAAVAAGQRHCRGRARPRHGAAVRPLSAARHHRLGHRAVLSVQQARIPRPQRRHFRDPAAVDRLAQDDRSRHDLFRDLDRGADQRAADHEPAGLPHRPRDPRAAARPHRRRSFRRAYAARQASGVHLCGGAGRPVRLALCAFRARRQPDAVRRAGRHRISVHRGGRRRRLCLGRRAGRGDRRDPEGDPAELSALYLRRPGPARNHRVRHPAGAAAATGARPASGRG